MKICSKLLLNFSRNGDSTTSLGCLFQSSTTISQKVFLNLQLKFSLLHLKAIASSPVPSITENSLSQGCSILGPWLHVIWPVGINLLVGEHWHCSPTDTFPDPWGVLDRVLDWAPDFSVKGWPGAALGPRAQSQDPGSYQRVGPSPQHPIPVH